MAGATDDTGLAGRLRTAPGTALAHLRRLTVFDVATYLVYLVALGTFVVPLLWVVSLSLSTNDAIVAGRLLPREVSLAAYRQVFRQGMPRWLLNSTVVSVTAVLGIVAVATPTAYAFSRFDFRGRRYLLLLVLVFQMISPVIIVLPMYTLMARLGLLESHTGLVLLYVGLQVPFSVWLLKGYFDQVPRELESAARIDGCNRLQMLLYVFLRPVSPGLVVVAIFNFVLTWSEFVMAFTVLSNDALYTVSIGIYRFQGAFGTDWPAIAAASVVGMVPMVLVFLVLQRYFVRGLLRGSVKT